MFEVGEDGETRWLPRNFHRCATVDCYLRGRQGGRHPYPAHTEMYLCDAFSPSRSLTRSLLRSRQHWQRVGVQEKVFGKEREADRYNRRVAKLTLCTPINYTAVDRRACPQRAQKLHLAVLPPGPTILHAIAIRGRLGATK